MRNIKLTIEYDGTDFFGWQMQPNRRTVQDELQKAISKIAKTEVTLIGSGRTDRGVHAVGQVANFRSEIELNTKIVQKAINANSPKDLVVTEVEDVPIDFHARFSAISRRYRYTILNRSHPSALLRDRVYFYRCPLILRKIDLVCEQLIGRRDFSSFQKTGSNRQHPICEVLSADLKRDGDLIFFEISANAFLRGMVRAIVGTFLQLEQVDDPVLTIRKIIEAKDRSAAGDSVPPQGLSLIEVKYENR